MNLSITIIEPLALHAYIIHHPHNVIREEPYVECRCTELCQYVLMNHVILTPNNKEHCLPVQSKNNGYCEALGALIEKTNIGLMQFLIEIYDIYMHLDIRQTLMTEFIIENKFTQENEKEELEYYNQYIQNYLIYWQEKSSWHFKCYRKDSSFEESIQKMRGNCFHFEVLKKMDKSLLSNRVMSENQWIVVFYCLLRDRLKWRQSDFEGILQSMRREGHWLQSKMNAIRKHSQTRLYEYSAYI